MPNIKSQKKRVLITEEEYTRNKAIRSKVKHAVKKFNEAIAAGEIATAEALLPETVSVINKAKSDGVYHINTASRKIASLNKALNAAKK
ncbi:MAG: 30S ribosomal protein S20 [Clostridia bacterium]|nr:30S ribosomal protein S20 [Clostridia bacterium]